MQNQMIRRTALPKIFLMYFQLATGGEFIIASWSQPAGRSARTEIELDRQDVAGSYRNRRSC